VTAFIGVLWGVYAVFKGLATLIWETAFNPPSFFQGIFELADGFLTIAKSAMQVLNPFNLVAMAIERIGATFSAVLSGLTGFFALLASPEAAKNILGIADAINSVSIPKAAATAGVALASAANTAVGAIAGRVGGGSTMTVEQPVEISINGDKLAKFIVKVTGENIRSIAAIQK
jgi:Zn-dependent protease